MQAGGQKILITGANGQLGRSVQDVAENYPQFTFHFMGREHLPINDFALVDKVVEALKPQAILNTAAYTAVDKAELESERANLMNGYAVGNLAAAAKRVGAKFIHISTDYVFNGLANEPYKEDHPTNPVNAYGASKLLGEKLAIQENADAIIIRTSWVYSKYGHNFVKTMKRLMQERNSIGVVNDQWGSPTFAHDLAEALLQIIGSAKWYPGIYHFCNAGHITWFQFAEAIRDIMGFSCIINPITTQEFSTPAQRPSYSIFDCQKIMAQFQLELQPWKQSLERCLSEMRDGLPA